MLRNKVFKFSWLVELKIKRKIKTLLKGLQNKEEQKNKKLCGSLIFKIPQIWFKISKYFVTDHRDQHITYHLYSVFKL